MLPGSSLLICFSANTLLELVKKQRAKRDELRRQLAEVELALSKNEAYVKEAVAREVEILNAWDASDFNNASISVPVSSDMVADFVGNDEVEWSTWLQSSGFVGASVASNL